MPAGDAPKNQVGPGLSLSTSQSTAQPADWRTSTAAGPRRAGAPSTSHTIFLATPRAAPVRPLRAPLPPRDPPHQPPRCATAPPCEIAGSPIPRRPLLRPLLVYQVGLVERHVAETVGVVAYAALELAGECDAPARSRGSATAGAQGSWQLTSACDAAGAGRCVRTSRERVHARSAACRTRTDARGLGVRGLCVRDVYTSKL